MLSADFGHLDRDTRMIDRSAAEWVHIDVMDGVFVPNISFGFPVLKAIRKATGKFLDVHLMIVEPEKYVARFAEAGADLVTFHYEATCDVHGCIEQIRRSGVRVGISIKPATSVDVLCDLLPLVDVVLVMSVEPGFGGQSFIPESLDKIARLRTLVQEQGLETLIEVDGGISSPPLTPRPKSSGCSASEPASRLPASGPASRFAALRGDFRSAGGGLSGEIATFALFLFRL